MDITRPLCHGRVISLDDDKELWVSIGVDALLTMIEIVKVRLILKAHWKNRLESTDHG